MLKCLRAPSSTTVTQLEAHVADKLKNDDQWERLCRPKREHVPEQCRQLILLPWKLCSRAVCLHRFHDWSDYTAS